MRHTTITIKRPEGHTEVVDVSEKFEQGLSDQMFAQIKKATMDAGKGECLSYDVTDNVSPEMLAEIKAHDDKCRWFIKHGFNASDVN